MDGVSAALYVDFDNVFSGLHKLDPAAAMALVEDPHTLLAGLACALTADGPRRWAVRRCYINSAGQIRRENQEPLLFSTFVQKFIQAGFEVIECAPYVKGAKNAADIKIVLDVVDALAGPTRYGEFVIASGDSDFAPLLVRIRAADRRTILISTVKATPSLTVLADRVIDGQAMLKLLGAKARTTQPGKALAAPNSTTPAKPAGLGLTPEVQEARAKFARAMRARFAAAKQPLPLSSLSQLIAAEVGPLAKSSRWFGHGSFMKAVASLDLEELERSQHHLWNARKHKKPRSAA